MSSLALAGVTAHPAPAAAAARAVSPVRVVVQNHIQPGPPWVLTMNPIPPDNRAKAIVRITMRGIGIPSLHITSATVTGPQASSFQVIADKPLPVTLHTDENGNPTTLNLQVRYTHHAGDNVEAVATLTVVTDDSVLPTKAFTLRGLYTHDWLADPTNATNTEPSLAMIGRS